MVAEWLYYRPKTKEIEVFSRDEQVFKPLNPKEVKGSLAQYIKEGNVRENALALSLITQLYSARYSTHPSPTDKAEIPKSLHKPIEAMRLYFDRPLRIAELAKLAGMSVSNFFRHFKAATGTSPIDWLKRERINQAKRRLLETNDSIAAIAEQTGYYDQFYFSRDFKRMTQVSPTEYRQRERAHHKLEPVE